METAQTNKVVPPKLGAWRLPLLLHTRLKGKDLLVGDEIDTWFDSMCVRTDYKLITHHDPPRKPDRYQCSE